MRMKIQPGKIAHLKNKCLIAIVSLLECNDLRTSVTTLIMRTIPLSVLTNNITRIFELYTKYEKDGYTEDLFNRMGQD